MSAREKIARGPSRMSDDLLARLDRTPAGLERKALEDLFYRTLNEEGAAANRAAADLASIQLRALKADGTKKEKEDLLLDLAAAEARFRENIGAAPSTIESTAALAGVAVPSALASATVRLSLADIAVPFSLESLTAQPPPRDYLLRTYDDDGVLVRGRVGLLAARGGSGKTMALIQLAVAVATGESLFGVNGWRASRGRVLLVLGEEDAAEITRRMHHAIRAADLIADESYQQVIESVTAIGAAGRGVALTADVDKSSGDLPETPRAEEIRQMLRVASAAGSPYSLVVLDPLSRFAGAETEKDNAAATRFVQVAETFCSQECGAPTVILAHHVRKAGKDDDVESSDPIRGASALVDGARWAAVLEPLPRATDAPDLVRLRVVKSNYARIPPPLTLAKSEHGCLGVASSEELAAWEAKRPVERTGRRVAPVEERIQSAKAAVLAFLATASRPLSGAEVRGGVKLNHNVVVGALHELEAQGAIGRTPDGRRWVPGTAAAGV